MRSILLLAAAALTACTSSESESETRLTGRNILDAATLASAESGQVSFTSHVKPILEAKCAVCHNQSGLPGRMSLASREDAVKTGALGAFIIPGKPDKSRFIDHLSATHASVKAMPPVGEALTPEEAALLRRWISQGAFWPAGSSGKLVTER